LRGDGHLAILIESEAWRFISTACYIGIACRKPGTKLSLKVTEILEEQLLPPKYFKKYTFFDEIYSKTDAGGISQAERTRLNVMSQTEFTYGEVLFPYFIPLIGLAKPKEGEVFWDLGCGTGKPMAIAALCFP